MNVIHLSQTLWKENCQNIIYLWSASIQWSIHFGYAVHIFNEEFTSLLGVLKGTWIVIFIRLLSVRQAGSLSIWMPSNLKYWYVYVSVSKKGHKSHLVPHETRTKACMSLKYKLKRIIENQCFLRFLWEIFYWKCFTDFVGNCFL